MFLDTRHEAATHLSTHSPVYRHTAAEEQIGEDKIDPDFVVGGLDEESMGMTSSGGRCAICAIYCDFSSSFFDTLLIMC